MLDVLTIAAWSGAIMTIIGLVSDVKMISWTRFGRI
jgi:hypothetical protein